MRGSGWLVFAALVVILLIWAKVSMYRSCMRSTDNVAICYLVLTR